MSPPKVFFSVSMSLDGFIAPPASTDELMGQRWMELQGVGLPAALLPGEPQARDRR